MKTFHRLAFTTGVAVVAACGVHVYTQGAPATLADCAVASLQAKAPTGTTITGARIVDPSSGLPKFCQVDGHTATPRTR